MKTASASVEDLMNAVHGYFDQRGWERGVFLVPGSAEWRKVADEFEHRHTSYKIAAVFRHDHGWLGVDPDWMSTTLYQHSDMGFVHRWTEERLVHWGVR